MAIVVALLIFGITGILTPIVMISGDSQVRILDLEVRGDVPASLAAGGGMVLVLAAIGVTTALGRIQMLLARTFLLNTAPEQLLEVTTSRQRLLRGFDAERRRIERDLHDGVQPLLVSVTMNLGLARSLLEPGNPGYDDVVAAHTQAKQLMGVMREVVNGIYPRVLIEGGLESACRDLPGKSVVPIQVRADRFPRRSLEVESIAYFCTSELLNNVNKHSGASEAVITLHVRTGVAMIDVWDNGQGGAAYGLGTGLTGVADRMATVGGTLSISSPHGGPTLVRLSLPAPEDIE